MSNILLCGSIDHSNQKAIDFTSALSKKIAEKGHTIYTGCSNAFDSLVAGSAFEYLKSNNQNADDYLVSYYCGDKEPYHQFGTILKSRLNSWMPNKRVYLPEQLEDADAVIIIGGKEGTQIAVDWARISNKLLLPVSCLGGTADEAYREEIKNFETKYANRVGKKKYSQLNQALIDFNDVATDIVDLTDSITNSKTAVVIMSYQKDAQLEDAFESFNTVCEKFLYQCRKTTEINSHDRLVSEIFFNIANSAFVIADISFPSPNVYFELGYAIAIRKSFVITAKKGTVLPFDVSDLPVIFWESQIQLKENLEAKIRETIKAQRKNSRP